jgi:murein L,D-transpeptidase YcbB/YkuD
MRAMPVLIDSIPAQVDGCAVFAMDVIHRVKKRAVQLRLKLATHRPQIHCLGRITQLCFAAIQVLLGTVLTCAIGAQSFPIKTIVSAASLDGMRWPNFRDYQASMQEFYETTGYAPAWIRGTTPTPQALAMIDLFRNAWKKGLEPEDYDTSRWDNRLRGLENSDSGVPAFDVAVTLCTMRYVSDLRVGRINPRHFKFGLSVEEKKYDLAQFLSARLLPAPDLPKVLEGIEPRFQGYRRAQQALARYIELARADNGEKLPVSEKPIDPGKPYAGVPRLTRLLQLLGDLPSDFSSSDPQVYDAALAEGVKHFQRRHGLDGDGRLGSATVKQLNIPLRDRVRQLQLTLERWRWLPEDFSAPPIIVNIPDFRLRALDENNNVALEMGVVVGKAMRSETPVFSRDMTYVVFRPYWNVPPGILRGEIVPAIKRDRGYISKKNFEVTTNDGEVVTSGEIPDDVLAKLQAGKLAVRQKPGGANALGLVKLIFPNEHNVYLHSTPAPELFSRSRRDFSHGCIRVEKPAEIAAWVLRNNPAWTLERAKEAMNSGPNDVTVKLNRSVPVFILYGTAIAYPDNEVHFYQDIYGHDASLAEALAKGYPYP